MPDVPFTSTDDACTMPPLSRMLGALAITPTSIASVPPATTVGLTATAREFAIRSTPAWTVVVPLCELLPDRVQVPLSALSRCTKPEPLVMPPAISPRPAPWSVNVRLPVAADVSDTPPASAAVPENLIRPASDWMK